MKKLVCHLLIVWLALMSGAVSAHSGYQDVHDGGLQIDHAAHAHVAASDTSNEADEDHADVCSKSHCGHGHSPGLLMPLGTCPRATAASGTPTSESCWATAAITNNIERPKWPVTTPAVVSLLA